MARILHSCLLAVALGASVAVAADSCVSMTLNSNLCQIRDAGTKEGCAKTDGKLQQVSTSWKVNLRSDDGSASTATVQVSGSDVLWTVSSVAKPKVADGAALQTATSPTGVKWVFNSLHTPWRGFAFLGTVGADGSATPAFSDMHCADAGPGMKMIVCPDMIMSSVSSGSCPGSSGGHQSGKDGKSSASWMVPVASVAGIIVIVLALGCWRRCNGGDKTDDGTAYAGGDFQPI